MTNVLEQIKGATAYDPSGEKIGKIHELYLDGQSREPKWASVHTGLFGMTESLVPLAGARPDGEDSVRVAVAKSAVKDAPHVDIGERISPADEATLAQYYGLRSNRPTSPPPSPQPGPDSTPSNGGKHLRGAAPALGGIGGTSANTTAHTHTGPEMIRSEERLEVGTERTTSGTARLNKHVVTEQRTVQVPVTHEEVRVERAPITDSAQARDARLADDQREVTLHEDQVVVSKESVPVERVRLAVDEVTENKHVTEDVRREEINADGVEHRRR